MDYLARESADLSDGLWNRIDETVIGTARAQLTCRRFLKVFGPLGAGVTTVAVDGVNKEEVLEDGIGRIVGRTQLELPLFYEDFTLLSRDMEYAAQTGYPLDLSVAATRSWCRPTCSSTCSACSRTPVCWRSTASRSSSATTCT